MKKKLSILFVVFMTIGSMTGSYSQKSGVKITIKGSVTDGAQNPVAGAIILIDGEKTNVMTDNKGFYKIKVRQENRKIGVLTIPNGIMEDVLDGRKNISFTYGGLVPDQNPKKVDPEDEPVNIGYQTVKAKDATVSVGKIDGTKSKYAGYNNIYDMIRGEIPGVQVSGNKIIIRSATSLTGSNDPLFVVDGVPVVTIDNISPQMVKSIEVLKGSAASIFGTRGSNGVILINLLKGNEK